MVTFRNTVSAIFKKLLDPDAEKLRLVEVSAEIIKNDVKCMDASRTAYPTPDDISR